MVEKNARAARIRLARRRIRWRAARVAGQKSKQTVERREFPDIDRYGSRKAVCRRCHVVMPDAESLSPHGEYWHPNVDKDGKPHWCPNSGGSFTDRDLEIEPFLRKRLRRLYKRNGIRP